MRRLQEFLDTQHSLSQSGKATYINAVKCFEVFSGCDFDVVYMDKLKVHEVLNRIKEAKKPSTWNTYLGAYQRLAKWLSDPEDDICPTLWHKIKPISIDWEEKLKDKWLTDEEFFRVLDVTDHPRDKAMYGVALEGGLRACELLCLKIRDCKPCSYGFDVVVSGKTGTSSFPVVLFAPLLRQWLNVHPLKNNIDSALWVVKQSNSHWGERYRALKYHGAFTTFKNHCKEAGITRNISLHAIRHTSITKVARNRKVGVNEEIAKKMFRWKKSSRMFGRYTHLFNTDAMDTYLALAGVKKVEDEKPSVLSNRKCFNCGELNSAEAVYCFRCGFVLSEEAARRLLNERKALDYITRKALEEMQKEEAEKDKN